MLKIGFVISPLLLLAALFTYAKAESNQVTVGMSVNSPVSRTNSSVKYSATETLADPENHSIIVIIKLKAIDDSVLPGLTVGINSNRGSIDIIEMFSSDDRTLLPVSSGLTDSSGEIKFRIGSFVPGDSIFSVVADTTARFDDQRIRFLSLPFPGNVEVAVPLPPDGAKKIVLIPKTPEPESTTPAREEARKLADVGTEINIPFSLFVIWAILLVASPVMLIIALFYLMRLRRHQKKEEELLSVIAGAEHMDEVKHFVNRTT